MNVMNAMRYVFKVFTIAFYIENSHLICSANQMTGFYKKRNSDVVLMSLLVTLNTFRTTFSTLIYCFHL